ncbi:MAG: tetratricopeptide repeat protein [Pseudomonadales bacterium]
MSGYTTREVSDLIGFKPQQVRHFVRRALIEPARGARGQFLFDFQDVVLLRTAKGLLEANISPRRTFRVLRRLHARLDQARPLAALRIAAQGNAVVVREQNQTWDAETGQVQMEFAFAGPTEAASVSAKVTQLPGSELPTITLKEVDAYSSDEWYNLGLDLEELDNERAPEAYARAIELDARNADAHVNLGRLLQLKGDLKRAQRHYELALAVAPSHQLALYNLGTVFDEQNELETALDFYRRAPAVPDAHYNLSRLSELMGDELSARRHMRQYRRLLEIDD